jgi:hypothetical protein
MSAIKRREDLLDQIYAERFANIQKMMNLPVAVLDDGILEMEKEIRDTFYLHKPPDTAQWWVAEKHCPQDVKDFGKNHNISTFAEATWMAGFIAGLRFTENAQKTGVALKWQCEWCGIRFNTQDERNDCECRGRFNYRTGKKVFGIKL